MELSDLAWRNASSELPAAGYGGVERALWCLGSDNCTDYFSMVCHCHHPLSPSLKWRQIFRHVIRTFINHLDPWTWDRFGGFDPWIGLSLGHIVWNLPLEPREFGDNWLVELRGRYLVEIGLKFVSNLQVLVIVRFRMPKRLKLWKTFFAHFSNISIMSLPSETWAKFQSPSGKGCNCSSAELVGNSCHRRRRFRHLWKCTWIASELPTLGNSWALHLFLR